MIRKEQKVFLILLNMLLFVFINFDQGIIIYKQLTYQTHTMNNYHHNQLGRLEDFSQIPFVTHPSATVKRDLQGFAQGSGKYESAPRNRQMGPLVTGGTRYDTYGTTPPAAYGGHPQKEQGCMDKCFSCLGKVLCCYCICDLIT